MPQLSNDDHGLSDFRSVLDAIPGITLLVDEDARISYMNGAANAHFGLKLNQVLSDHVDGNL